MQSIDWSTNGLPNDSVQCNTLFTRELTFDWGETGMPTPFQSSKAAQSYQQEMGPMPTAVDWSSSTAMPWQVLK